MTTQPPTYEPNTPQVKDNFADSQITFSDNFFTLYNAFLTNHVALDAASGAGNHTIIQLPEQDKDTQFQTDVGEISIYCKDVPGQTDQIFLRYQGNQDEFQFTNYQIYSIKETAIQTFYFTFLPGKVLICFGNIIANGKVTRLNIKPNIAKKIVTANFCVNSATPGFPPELTIPAKNTNKIITHLNLNYFLSISNLNLFYFLAVNI